MISYINDLFIDINHYTTIDMIKPHWLKVKIKCKQLQLISTLHCSQQGLLSSITEQNYDG